MVQPFGILLRIVSQFRIVWGGVVETDAVDDTLCAHGGPKNA